LGGSYAFKIPDYGVGIVDIADTKDTYDFIVKFFNASDPDVPQQASSNISFEDALLKAIYKVGVLRKKKQWDVSSLKDFDTRDFKYK
jgi:hypothetical protein